MLLILPVYSDLNANYSNMATIEFSWESSYQSDMRLLES